MKDAFELERLSTVGGRADAGGRGGLRGRAARASRSARWRRRSRRRCARPGYERPAFETIVASGPNAALPHHRAGDRRIEIGDLVVLDFGGVLDGYCSDLTRTVSVGPPSRGCSPYCTPPSWPHSRPPSRPLGPGSTRRRSIAAARAVLEQAGLGEAFGHGTGHGLGLEVHEEPRLSRTSTGTTPPPCPLQPGMVVTIEPGAYLPGWGGVRIEDDVVVTSHGLRGADVGAARAPRVRRQTSGSPWI